MRRFACLESDFQVTGVPSVSCPFCWMQGLTRRPAVWRANAWVGSMDLQGSEISRVWYGAEISRVCYENRDFAALLKNVKARNPQTVRMDAAAATESIPCRQG